MKGNKRLLAPGFLNRLDKWLMQNKPETWSARTHLVIYYGGGFILLLTLLTFIFPDDPRSSSGIFNWVLFTSIITLIAFVVWLIYLLRFNVFKRFGVSTAVNRVKTFLLYFISICIIMLIPFVQSFVESTRANAAYGDNELVNDMNNINMKIVQLELDSLHNTWDRDTVRVVDTIPRYHEEVAVYDDQPADTTVISVVGPTIKLIDTADFRTRMLKADSSEMINDSVYVFLDCPSYIFIQDHSLDDYATVHQFNSLDIYRKIVQHYKKPDRKAVQAELQVLIEKYKYPHRGYYYSDNRNYDVSTSADHTYEKRRDERYSLDTIDRSINNITQRKSYWRGDHIDDIFHIFFYLTLIPTLLIFVFRHTTVRTFFITLLSGFVICILSALLIALGHAEFSGFLVMLLFYYLIFAVVGAMAWQSKIRSIVSGVGINLFTWMTPFIPLIVVALYYAILDEAPYQYDLHHDRYNYEIKRMWFTIAEIAGPVIFLALTGTYIHRLYRKWYSLPQE